MRMKVVVIFGTRPEVIKLAPVVKELEEKGHEVIKVAVGQHTQLLEMALRDFRIEGCLRLDIERKTGSLIEIAHKALEKLKAIEDVKELDWVVVQGDTLTTFLGAMAGFLAGVKVCHVEAGLRTWNLASPFPEEGMRQMVSRISSLNCCPTQKAINNLWEEGKFGPATIAYVTGNTVVDAINMVSGKYYDKQNHVLMTIHRREKDSDDIKAVMDAVREFCELSPDWVVTFPCHPNPVIREAIKPVKDHGNLHVVDPVSYPECLDLILKSKFVLTDSGGIQEECGALAVPVIVCRENTERPESVSAGASVLAGSDKDTILKYMLDFKEDEKRKKHEVHVTAYGDGRAAKRIVTRMEEENGR